MSMRFDVPAPVPSTSTATDSSQEQAQPTPASVTESSPLGSKEAAAVAEAAVDQSAAAESTMASSEASNELPTEPKSPPQAQEQPQSHRSAERKHQEAFVQQLAAEDFARPCTEAVRATADPREEITHSALGALAAYGNDNDSQNEQSDNDGAGWISVPVFLSACLSCVHLHVAVCISSDRAAHRVAHAARCRATASPRPDRCCANTFGGSTAARDCAKPAT
jgi:hypothetical protein